MIKNRTFQPVGVLLRDGSMLHLAPRAQREIAPAEMEGAHLKGVLASGQLAVLGERASGGDADAPEPGSGEQPADQPQ